jgi:tRNA threonylcarbamoyladenosine biosynthesis protein TsaE
MTWTLTSLDELPVLAKTLLNTYKDYRVWLFEGEMGAGKTTLIQVLCKQLGVTDSTSSPTFSLVNVYESDPDPVYHFDFYRIEHEYEAMDMGYEEYFYSGHYCFVEWPSKIASLLPDQALHIQMEVDETGHRILHVQPI